MFNTIRKNQKGLMIIVTLLTIIAFAWLYNPADTRELGANVAAKAYGRTFTQADIDRQIRQYQLALALGQLDLVSGLGGMTGNESADLSEYVWNVIVLRHEAAALGVEPTTEQVAARIRELPAFQTNGQFDPRKFETFSTNQLGPRGMSVLQLEDVIRDALRLEKMKTLIGSPASVGARETSRALRFFQKADLVVLPFPLQPVMDSITVSEADARSYFEKNPAQFVAPESLTVEFAKFSLPEDQKAAEGKDKVSAQQVLASKAAGLAEAAAGDFAGAAKAAGAEVGTSDPFDRRAAASGGPLPPAVMQGAFLLTESQTISDVTQAGDDFYVFRVANRQPERPLTFEEARPMAELRLKSNEAARLLREKSVATITKIREAMQSGTPMAEAAIAAGVTPQTFTGVDPARPELPMEFVSAARVAVMLEPGQISNFLPTATGGAAVGVVSRGTEAAVPGAEEMAAQLLENKQELFFAVWLDSRRQAAKIEIPRRQGQ